MKLRLTIPVFYLIAIILSGPAFAQADLKKLDAYYAKALKDWNVPGMSIAIVKDGKVVFAKGYGVKEAGKPDKADENTLYAIASNTKAFTSMILGQLVDEGKISWDDRVRKYVPYFELSDSWISDNMTIRDILSHRSGLKTFGGDIIWYRANLNAEEIIRRVKHLPISFDFRSGYGYSNVMYLTAGEVIRAVTGKSYGEALQERIFSRIGMNRSTWTTKDLEKFGNYAMPHSYLTDQHKPIPWEDWGTIAAMGGIVSSVNDMAKWAILNLNHGIWNTDTLVSKSARNMMWTPHNVFGVDHTDADNNTHIRGYGLGWSISDYRGRLRVGHTGGYGGMLSAVTLVPDEKLGVIVLTNGMRGIYSALVNYTVDAFLKAPERDWSGEYLKLTEANKDTRVDERKKAQVKNTKPSVSLEKFTGTYETPTYGKIIVSNQQGQLNVAFEHTPDLAATLEHWHYDTFQLHWKNPEMLSWFSFGTVKFATDNNANVVGIEFDVPNNDFWFEELNAKKVK